MTKDTNQTPNTLADADILRQIEAYGADTARWRAPAGGAASKSPATAPALREAEALDRLLAMAAPKKASIDDAELVDRIVAAAGRMPRVVTGNAEPGAAEPKLAIAANPSGNVVKLDRRLAVGRVFGTDLRRGFAVLAASLVLGLSIGQSGLMDRAVAGFEELTGVAIAPVSQDITRALTLDQSVEDL